MKELDGDFLTDLDDHGQRLGITLLHVCGIEVNKLMREDEKMNRGFMKTSASLTRGDEV